MSRSGAGEAAARAEAGSPFIALVEGDRQSPINSRPMTPPSPAGGQAYSPAAVCDFGAAIPKEPAPGGAATAVAAALKAEAEAAEAALLAELETEVRQRSRTLAESIVNRATEDDTATSPQVAVAEQQWQEAVDKVEEFLSHQNGSCGESGPFPALLTGGPITETGPELAVRDAEGKHETEKARLAKDLTTTTYREATQSRRRAYHTLLVVLDLVAIAAPPAEIAHRAIKAIMTIKEAVENKKIGNQVQAGLGQDITAYLYNLSEVSKLSPNLLIEPSMTELLRIAVDSVCMNDTSADSRAELENEIASKIINSHDDQKGCLREIANLINSYAGLRPRRNAFGESSTSDDGSGAAALGVSAEPPRGRSYAVAKDDRQSRLYLALSRLGMIIGRIDQTPLTTFAKIATKLNPFKVFYELHAEYMPKKERLKDAGLAPIEKSELDNALAHIEENKVKLEGHTDNPELKMLMNQLDDIKVIIEAEVSAQAEFAVIAEHDAGIFGKSDAAPYIDGDRAGAGAGVSLLPGPKSTL